MQADGTILIDTTISDDGFKAGAKDVELAARRMAKTVGDIGDKAKQALEKQVDSFSKLNAQYAEQEKKVNSLKEKVEEFASQKVPTQEFVDIQKQITETEKKLAALNDRKEKFLATGGKTKSRTFAAMQYDIEQLEKTLAYAKAEKEALEKSDDWYVSGFNTEAGQKAAAQLKAEQQKLFEMNGRLNESFSSLKKKVASYGGSLDDTSERVSRASGAFSAVKNGVAAVGKAALSTAKALAKVSISAAKMLGSLTKLVGQKILGGLVKLTAGIYGIHKSTNKSVLSLKNLIKYGLGIRSLFALFNKLRSAITDGFKNLAQYSSGTNKDISSLMSSLTQLKNSFATAFAPILSAVAPALNYLIGLLNAAVTAIAQFMAALTGKSTVVKATKVQQDYAKSLQKTGSAAKKAAGELASFDKLNVKKNDSSSGSGGGSVSPSQMFETTPIENSIKGMADKIRSLIKAQDWSGLGEYLAQGINAGLQKVYDAINWDHVGPKITAFVNAFTQTFNSLVKNIDWNLMGKTVGAGINTIVNILNLLVDGIDWVQLGSKIAEGFNGLVDEVNWENVGKLFVAKFNILYQSMLGFVTTFDWSKAGTAIGKGINGAIANIDLKSAAKAVSGLVKGIFDAISAALTEGDWQAVGEKITEGLATIDYAGIADSVFYALGAALSSLGEFVYGLFHDSLENMKSYFTEYAKQAGGNWAAGILSGIIDAVKNIGTWIKEHIFQPFINGFQETFGIHSPSTVMAEMGGYLIEGLKKGITDMMPGLNEVIDSLKQAVNGLITFINGTFTGDWGKAWEGIKDVFKGVFNGIITIAENAVNYIVRALNKVSFDVPDWIPEIGGKTFGFQLQEVRLPRLASGTVVPPRAGEFAAILGDNKKETEVVSPLSTMKQALKEALQEAGGLGGGDIVGYIYLDGKEMGASTVKFVRQEKKRTGKNPVLV
nr:MAG TPA: minor tail protein [Bacteriophage sp.]